MNKPSFLRARVGVFSISLLLLCCAEISAQEVIFSKLSVEDGLLSNFVRSVWQSPEGYLWIGTENGLQRYDGSAFVNPNRGNRKNKVPALPVTQIVQNNNQVWLHVGGYFGVFDPKNMGFTNVPIRSAGQYGDLSTARLIPDGSGNMFLLIPSKTLLVFDSTATVFLPLKEFPGLTHLLIPADFQPSGLTVDPAAHDIYFSGKQGIGIYSYKDKAFYQSNDNPRNLGLLLATKNLKNFSNISFSATEGIWLTSGNAGETIFQLFDQKSNTLRVKPARRNFAAYDYRFRRFAAVNNQTWIYGSGLLNMYEQGSGGFEIAGHNVLDHYGIQFNAVHEVYGDRDNNIWIATDNGLYKARIQENSIRHGYLPQLQNHAITAACEFEPGVLSFASRGRGVFTLSYDDSLEFSKAHWRKDIFEHSAVLKDTAFREVLDMLKERNNSNYWFTCREGRLIKWNAETKSAQYLVESIFEGDNVQHIAEDNFGQIWFGTNSGKLVVLKHNKFSLATNIGSEINKMLIDKHGRLWIGSENDGASIFDPVTNQIIQTYPSGNSSQFAHNNPVNDILQLDSLNFLLACSGSINVIHIADGIQHVYDGNNGMPAIMAYAVQKDTEQRVWVSTNGGLFRFDWINGAFYNQEGLVKTTNQWNVFTNSVLLINNRLLYTGPNSLLIFDPMRLKSRTKSYDVAITDFRLFNRYLPLDSLLAGKIELAYDQNSIAISFSSFNFDRDDKFEYFYRLIGADTTWIRADKFQTAGFSALAPEHYTFEVKSISTDGSSTEKITRFPFYIKPAYWQTTWFKVLVFLAAMIPILVIYRLRIRRLLELQRLRESVARDLHDDVGSTLTSISILSTMATKRIATDPLVAEDYMQKIRRNSSEMMQAMDDIVWSIKPSNDNLNRIVARMREYMASVLESKGVSCHFEIDPSIERTKLSMEYRRGLFMIYKEAINNIAKYAQATRVDVQLTVKDKILNMSITDNGVGIPDNYKRMGNGLGNMRQRSEDMNGTFHLASEAGKGTIIEISMDIR